MFGAPCNQKHVLPQCVRQMSCLQQVLEYLYSVCGCRLQVLRHEWVTDSGKLPPVQHYSGSSSQWVGGADAHSTEQAQVLTALKKQVSSAEN
jgi:hypothetical protein